MGIITAWSLLGVCFGVLTANAPPAKIFMGDSGSTLIGVVLAFLSLNWVHIEPAGHSMAAPIIFLGIPLADVALAILRRTRSRAALFMGDRYHYYDILLRQGWTVRRVLEVSIGTSCLLVLVGWLSARGMLSAIFAVVISAIGLASAAYFLGSLQLVLKHAQSRHEGTPLGSALD
jgi:UDP-GlcNAc:undecaprenyl-phosphate/decaprenyl-phosphate GlcNAc-1-phosphate transferase